MMSDKIRILYIDDYELDRELVKDALEKEHGGFEVTEASDKREFEALLKNREFDVVLSDLNIAGFEGLHVLEAVRAYDPRIPIIIVTGTGSEEIAVMALKQGAADYVIKRPKHILKLPQTIFAAIEKQTLRDQHQTAELSLKESEKQYRSLFEKMMNGYCYCRMLFDRNKPQDFIYLVVNRAFESLTGLKNVVGKRISEVIPGIQGTDPELFEICGRVALTGIPETFEMYIEALSMWFSISVYRHEKEHFVAVFDVITERKRNEEALKKSEEKYRHLVESTADWVWACDPEGRQTYANKAVKGILDYEVHEIIGALAANLMHPEDAKRMQKWLNKSVKEKKGWKSTVLRWKHKDGTIRFLESTARPILDSQGDLVGFVGIDRDVTERLRLEQQLIQTQKMEAIGTLAGGVAHDFNNLLSVIIGNADLMLMELKKDHPFYEGIMEIRKAGTGAASLTRQLLAFSRKQVIQPEIMNLNDVINTTIKMLERLIGENIELQTFLDPALEPLEVDHGQMEQVIINLSVNARDAMPTGGKLTVETENLDLDEDFFKTQGIKSESGPYVILRVSDTGSGMDQEIIAHIFDPFFTTKEMERGTGLGLSTVYGIIKQNNGYIFVQSKPGKGSAFEIYLPAVKKEKKSVVAETVTEDSLAGSETILLVEDDMQLQKLTSRILERYGYRILQASNGDKALKVSQKHDGPIDLILTDVIMPGMNVREMAERIQSRRKETRILYMSGYMDDTISHYGVLEPGIDFLQKPYTPEGLARKVREVLDRKIDD